jgi:zinc transport system permease protein
MIMNSSYFATFIVAMAVGGVAAYLGSLMVTKRMALVGDALGHVALPGMGLALVFGIDISLGAFVFILLGILLVWSLSKQSSLGMETLVGIVFVTSLALGFLIVPQPDLLESLIGDVSKVSLPMAGISVLILLPLFWVIRKIYPGMVLLNISEDLAQVQGIHASKYNLIYLMAIAVIVSLGIKVTGTLLVGALVIIPAATARNLSGNLQQYSYGSMIIGIISSTLGVLLYQWSHFPAGPAIILVNALLFAISFFYKRSFTRY